MQPKKFKQRLRPDISNPRDFLARSKSDDRAMRGLKQKYDAAKHAFEQKVLGKSEFNAIKSEYWSSLKIVAENRRRKDALIVWDRKFPVIDSDAAFNENLFKRLRQMRTQRKKQAFSMALIDLDNFGLVNKRYGHAAGDAVLKRATRIVTEFAESHGGFAGRFGGEELKVFVPLPEAELKAGLEAVNKALFAETSNPRTFGIAPKTKWSGWKGVSFSAGVTGNQRIKVDFRRQLNLTVDKFYNAIDYALSRAKNAGKNRVAIFGTKIR